MISKADEHLEQYAHHMGRAKEDTSIALSMKEHRIRQARGYLIEAYKALLDQGMGTEEAVRYVERFRERRLHNDLP